MCQMSKVFCCTFKIAPTFPDFWLYMELIGSLRGMWPGYCEGGVVFQRQWWKQLAFQPPSHNHDTCTAEPSHAKHSPASPHVGMMGWSLMPFQAENAAQQSNGMTFSRGHTLNTATLTTGRNMHEQKCIHVQIRYRPHFQQLCAKGSTTSLNFMFCFVKKCN